MARSTVEVELVALVKEATKTVDKFANTTQKQLDGINFKNGISALSDGFNLIEKIAGGAFSKISDYISDAVRETIEAERSNTKLAQSMRLVGDFTNDALESFNELAEALDRTTSFSSEQIKQAAALAKAYSLTNKEAQLVVKAAVELSSITGQDLNSSVEQLSKTFNGLAGKNLKQLVREIEGLSQEQLANGEAVKLLLDRYSGTATTLDRDFGGALDKLNKSFGSFNKAIGGIITQSEKLKNIIRSTADVINQFSDYINKADFNLSELALSLLNIINPFSFFIKLGSEQLFDPLFKNLNKDLDKTKIGLDKVNKALLDSQEAAKKAAEEQNKDKDQEERIKAQRKALQERKKALEDFNSIRNKVESLGLSEVEKINKDSADNIAIIQRAIRTGAIDDVKAANKLIAGIEEERARKVAEIEERELQKALEKQRRLREEFNQQLQSIFQDPIRLFVKTDLEGSLNLTDFEKKLVAAGAGFISQVGKGAEGARKLLIGSISTVGQALFGPIGSAFGDIADLLLQGPEKFKEQVTEFAKALPDLIESLAQSLPILIETLVRELPPALAKAMPTVAAGFSTALIANLPSIVQGFARGLIDAAKQFGQAVVDFIKTGGGLFGGEGGIGGGISDFFSDPLGSIGDFLGSISPFAEGGRVPDVARFQGDRFPARLDAGEQVLSQDLSDKLDQFLSGGGGGGNGQPIQINLNIGLQQFAKIMLEADRLGYRVRAT